MKDKATPEMIAMARRIADATVENHAAARGTHTWEIARDAALAAIIETQRLDADLVDRRKSPFMTHADAEFNHDLHVTAAAIRAGHHYGKDSQ